LQKSYQLPTVTSKGQGIAFLAHRVYMLIYTVVASKRLLAILAFDFIFTETGA